MTVEKRHIALTFFDMGVVKFGKYKLKSGVISPIYVDLRVLISSPKFMDEVAQALITLLHDKETYKPVDLICGVPYSALPIAACISVRENIPMVMCRKESKSYGTKQMIEGLWKNGQSCVIIEDVVTSGSSVSSVAKLLRESGMCIEHAVIIIDREQGGPIYLKKENIKVSSLFTLTELLSILFQENCITSEQLNESIQFIRSSPAPEVPIELKFHSNQLNRLNQIIKLKESRLCVAVDTSSPYELLKLTDQIGSEICAVKLHLDILHSIENPEMIIKGLCDLSSKHGFLIVEDRKLADIGQTVFNQLLHGVYKIAEWCDLVTVHCLPGPGLFEAFRKVNQKLLESDKNHQIAALVVAEMSCQGTLTTESYMDQSVSLIKTNSDIIGGFVAQHPLPGLHIQQSSISYWVPGIKLVNSNDDLGQNYNTPDHVYKRFTNDHTTSPVIMIVGRGITEAQNVTEEAKRYRLASINNTSTI